MIIPFHLKEVLISQKRVLLKIFFKQSKISSICDDKGVAYYYNVEVNGKFRDEAAWSYPETTGYTKRNRELYCFFGKVLELKMTNRIFMHRSQTLQKLLSWLLVQ